MKVRTSVLAILGLAFASGAMAETVNCTAIVPPVTISTPGIYCLKANANTNLIYDTAAAIKINASNVVVDLNGFTIDNSAAGSATYSSGISAVGALQNIAVRNGTLRGFKMGINMACIGASSSCGGYVVEGITAAKNIGTGISVSGPNNIVRRNIVAAIGPAADGTSATGISVGGQNARVIDNDVQDVVTTGTQTLSWATGIFVTTSTNAEIVGNRIGRMNAGISQSTGILLQAGSVPAVNAMIRDNVIADSQYGIYFYGSQATGKYMGNMTQGVVIPYTGGTPAGSTNY